MKRLGLILASAVLLTACGGSTKTVTQVKKVPVPPTYQTPYGRAAHSPTFGLNQHPNGVLPPPLSLTAAASTYLMLDSVDSYTVFDGLHPFLVAGYTAGSWPTYSGYQQHFQKVVAVAIQASYHGIHGAIITCLDVEPGDASPSQAGGWVVYEAQHHFRPCVYGSLSEFGAINSSIASAHVTVHVFKWCADWTYFAHLDSGCDAVQWTDHYLNRNIDGSTVTAAFANVSTKPKPPPTPACWGKDQHSTTCKQVRRNAYLLAQREKKQAGYLKVSQHNASTLNRQIAVLQHRVAPINSRVKSESSSISSLRQQRCSLEQKYHRSC